jgi:ArsR family transcriptional regulator, arsenate/arsenite/antimonite-responsive transcriptional repressor
MAVAELPVIDCCTPLADSSLSAERAAELERVIKALADRHRLRIVNLLLRAHGEPVCVCEIQPLLGLAQGTVSHHLKQLVEAGILARETSGTYSHFSLVPGALDAVRDVFSTPPRLAVAGESAEALTAGERGAATAAACC